VDDPPAIRSSPIYDLTLDGGFATSDLNDLAR
jgi:hypothetical protein